MKRRDYVQELRDLLVYSSALDLGRCFVTPIENFRGIAERKDLTQDEARGWVGMLRLEIARAERKAGP